MGMRKRAYPSDQPNLSLAVGSFWAEILLGSPACHGNRCAFLAITCWVRIGQILGFVLPKCAHGGCSRTMAITGPPASAAVDGDHSHTVNLAPSCGFRKG